MKADIPASIDEYIARQPSHVGNLLEQIRSAIQASVPAATEAIRYGMPTFQLNGKNMVHFAGFTKHVGFYATPDGHNEFEAELSQYKRGKGSVQFPIDEPLPFTLITRISIYRSKQLSEGE